MKTKIALCSYLSIHIIAIILVNIYPFKSLQQEEQVGMLTDVGDWVVHQSEIPNIPFEVASTVSWYTKLIGSNRGFEFFAPNVPKGTMRLTFVTDSGEELKMMNSIESQTKVMTALSFLSSKIVENESWEPLIRSICQRFLVKYPQVDAISVYVNIIKFQGRQEVTQHITPTIEKKLLLKIKRHEKNSKQHL